ncbi:MAG: HD domain-containing protein [Bacteroidetes bacterium]|nr:HD domain-containing protein [Bacteroidota bacterium]
MHQENVLQKSIAFIKETLAGAEGGHDWQHISRVWNTAKYIAGYEKSDQFIVELGALFHDIADSKFHSGDESIGPKIALKFLLSIEVDEPAIDHVIKIIENISFKGGNELLTFKSPELDIVQDADRLDAMGAIGIARTFSYGGFLNREIYNPDIPPNLQMTREEYKKSAAPVINHFYEKLLLLKDRMNTGKGRELAIERHDFMEQFLAQFYREVGKEVSW